MKQDKRIVSVSLQSNRKSYVLYRMVTLPMTLGARRLWFKLYCQRWRTFQGHGQSRTLEKWQYLWNGAR